MKKLLPIFALIVFSGSLNARQISEYQPKPDEDKEWVENQQDLPPYPAMDSPAWQEIVVEKDDDGKAYLLTDNIRYLDDGTVRYVLNLKSKNGIDNISAEGLLCKDKTQRIYAFGDTTNHRWIESKNSKWQALGTSSMRQNQVAYTLYTVFCA
ncbi:MAG: hypothetical protein IKZ88_06750, partial [Neisseriaceae bacterium]|nr:hypothetical protein [Neisseriaceae bacterium]